MKLNNSSHLAPATIICRSTSALYSSIGDETVLMSLERGNYYGLDAIATDIWLRLEEPVSIGDLCARLVEEYEADLPTIQQDVLNLLEQLRTEGFLDVQDHA